MKKGASITVSAEAKFLNNVNSKVSTKLMKRRKLAFRAQNRPPSSMRTRCGSANKNNNSNIFLFGLVGIIRDLIGISFTVHGLIEVAEKGLYSSYMGTADVNSLEQFDKVNFLPNILATRGMIDCSPIFSLFHPQALSPVLLTCGWSRLTMSLKRSDLRAAIYRTFLDSNSDLPAADK